MLYFGSNVQKLMALDNGIDEMALDNEVIIIHLNYTLRHRLIDCFATHHFR